MFPSAPQFSKEESEGELEREEVPVIPSGDEKIDFEVKVVEIESAFPDIA